MSELPPLPPPPAAMPQAAPEPAPETLAAIVELARSQGYSDIHLGVGEEPRFRAQGEITASGWPPTDTVLFDRWLSEVLGSAEREQFRLERDFDGSFAFERVRVRINLMESLLGPAMVLRLIPQTILSLEELKLPEVLKALADRPKGLVLVTGPTGSGKSTTLAAMVDWINRQKASHILTIEDPIEFVHTSKRSLVRQREVGHHTLRFKTALRAALREDPDVILIGEIRDGDTLTTALEASQTGHLVFGTLHTNSAVRTVERVLGMVPPEDQPSLRRALSESLLGVIAQGLIRSRSGRRAFHDILINTEACRDYIERGELDAVEQIMERSGFDGMVTANQSLQALVEAGEVDGEAAVAVSLKPNELTQALRGRQ